MAVRAAHERRDVGPESGDLAPLRQPVVAVGWTPITDTGLKHLKGLKKLRRLTLHHTAITDAGLGHLSGLTNVVVLAVGGTRITNAGLPHLKGLANLVYLDLGPSEVTDAGVEHLTGLKELQVAYFPRHISEQAMKRLRAAVPGVKVSSFPKRAGDYLTDPGNKKGDRPRSEQVDW